MNTNTISLLYFLSYSPDKPALDSFLPTSLMEWKEVMRVAQKHQVVPMLYHRLIKSGISIPEEILNEAKVVFLKLAYQNIRLYECLEKILSAFDKESIKVIVLKGAYLAEKIYPNIGLRSMCDIDLLVQDKDLEITEKALLAMGYEPVEKHRVKTKKKHHFAYKKVGSTYIEVHWTLNGMYLNQLNPSEFWKNAQKTTIVNIPAFTLAPEELLLHLCLHTAHNIFSISLSMLIDICELINKIGDELDWTIIRSKAHQWGIHQAVYAILLLSKELLRAQIPEEKLIYLQPQDFDSQCIEFLKNSVIKDQAFSLIPQSRSSFLFDKIGIRTKLKIILDVIFPSKDFLSLHYSASSKSFLIFCYYPIHWIEVIKRNWMQFQNIVFKRNVTNEDVKRKNDLLKMRDWLLTGYVSAIK